MTTETHQLASKKEIRSAAASIAALRNSSSTDIRDSHWHRVDEHVAHWLSERQEMLMLLCAVRGLQEYTPENTPISVKVSALCQVLIDYVSAGHFEIYTDFIQEAEYFNDKNQDLLEKTIPLISLSTEDAMEFNDLFGDGEASKEDYEQLLTLKLSNLAEKLEGRFELEDTLIKEIHYAHAKQMS